MSCQAGDTLTAKRSPDEFQPTIGDRIAPANGAITAMVTGRNNWPILVEVGRTLWRAPSWRDRVELMDQPGHPDEVVRGNLNDLARVNRLVGGISLTHAGFQRLIGDVPPGCRLTILDVACGGADVPRELVTRYRRSGVALNIIGLDLSRSILSVAGDDDGECLSFIVADARQLPLDSDSVDIAMSSLALHHLQPSDALAMLGEMSRVARCGILVNDLLRSWHGYWGARLMSRWLTRNPLTRYDAPLSVLRAYTRPELESLVAVLGLRDVQFREFAGVRFVMTGRVPN